MAEVSTKLVRCTDTKIRFELPTKTLKHINFPPGENSVDLLVKDESGKPWTFSCRKRWVGHPKPFLTTGWLKFVRSKGIRVGNRVIFHKLDGDELRIEVKRETAVKFLGKYLWAHVEDAHPCSVA